jgi:hypothetical protein
MATTTAACINFCQFPLVIDEIGTLGDGRHFMFSGACAQEVDSLNLKIGSPVQISSLFTAPTGYPAINSLTGGTVWSDPFAIGKPTYVTVGGNTFSCPSAGTTCNFAQTAANARKMFEYFTPPATGITFQYSLDAPTATANFERSPSNANTLESVVQCASGASPPATATTCTGQPITAGWSFAYGITQSRTKTAVNVIGTSSTASGYAIQTMTQTTLASDTTWVFDTTLSDDLGDAMGCPSSG